MGQDLIAVTAIGPRALSRRCRATLIRRLDARSVRVRALLTRVLGGADAGDLPVAQRRLWASIQPGWNDYQDAEDPDDSPAEALERAMRCQHLVRDDIPDLVDRLLDFWNDGFTRDAAVRDVVIEGRSWRVVTCGDSSWGDPPEGDGYRLLMAAATSGLWPLAGLI